LLIFSASNFADINDIREDKKLGVKTLPVLYGKQLTSYISFAAVAIAAILLVENPNFENRFWINSIIEVQHIGLMCVIYNNTKF
jgi:4-hydroxybenzoate polyprenyltransferase